MAGLLLSLATGTGAQQPDGSIGGRPAPVPPDTNTLAILPFNVSGPPDSEYLGESMMDLLAMALDGRAGIKVLYPQFVLRHVGAGARRTDPTAAAPIVRDLGAGRVVGGSVVVAGAQLRISVDVFDARQATLLFPLRAQGTVQGLAAATDTLASLLLARRLVPASVLQQRGLAEYATSSPDALRAVLVGEQAMRRGEYKVAADSFKSALRLDPDFGLAHQSIISNEGKALGVSGPGFSRASLVENAARRVQRFPPRIRRQVEYYVAYDRGDRYRAIQLANALAADYPTDGEALALQADANHHLGRNIGVPMPAILDMFRAALRVDDAHVELLQHFYHLLIQVDDTTAALAVKARCGEVAERACDRDRNEFNVKYLGARPWAGPFSAEARQRIPDWFFLNLNPTALPFAAAVVDSSFSMVASPANPDLADRNTAYLMKLMIAYVSGRHEAAWQLIDSARLVGPASPNLSPHHARLRLHSIVTGQHLDSAAATLSFPAPTSPLRLATRAWYATHHMTTEAAELHLRELTSGNPNDSTLLASIVTGLRGIRALRGGDTAQARNLLAQSLRHHGRRGGLDRMMWPASEFIYELARIQHARRDYAGARRTLLDLYPAFESALFLAPGEELRANVELALGDTTAARVALRNFIGLWDKADPPLQPRVAAARALLARIDPP